MADGKPPAAQDSWTHGMRSVLDVKIDVVRTPIEPDPPVRHYLEEVPIGMKGGLGDPRAEELRQQQEGLNSTVRSEGSGGSPSRTPWASSLDRMRALSDVLKSEVCEDACRTLFWLVMGGMFQRVAPPVLEGLRQQLGNNWTRTQMGLQGGLESERPLKDWILASLPLIFSQAIFRLLCDGFPDDRKYLLGQSDDLIVRTVLIVHFELFGFQIFADTVKKNRKRLFLRSAFKNPYVNQREVLRGQKQQKLLESEAASLGDRPLVFGKLDGNPLQESQLEHVMQGHRDAQEMQHGHSAPMTFGGPAPQTVVPPELSVDRYEDVTSTGMTMLDHHLALMSKLAGDDEFDMEENSEFVEAFLRIDQNGSGEIDRFELDQALQQLGYNLQPEQVKAMIDEVDKDGNGQVNMKEFLRIMNGLDSPKHDELGGHPESGSPHGSDSECGEPDSPKLDSPAGPGGRRRRDSIMSDSDPASDEGSPTSAGKKMNLKAVFRNGLIMSKFKSAGGRGRSKRARDRKQQQELLMQNTVQAPLPKEFTSKELVTTWVSPPMMNKVHASDRLVLRKRMSETFQVKMEGSSPTSRMTCTPLLEAFRKQRRSLKESTSVPQMLMSKEDTMMMRMRTNAADEGGDVRERGKSLTSSAGALPRLGASGGHSKGAVQQPIKGELISLEPPPRLGAKVALGRLEDDRKAFQRTSFANYVKEHEVLTGVRRMRFDFTSLQAQEDAAIRKVDSLVRGQPKRLIPPEPMLARMYRAKRGITSGAPGPGAPGPDAAAATAAPGGAPTA